MENSIELQNVSKKYKDFELKNISFNVPQGCIVGLIGENGAGKTTTIKSILNITKSEGTIKIFGKDSVKNEKEIKEETGVVLDDSFLSEYLTAKQVNSIMKEFYKTWNEEKYISLLKQFNLPTDELLENYGIIKCSKEDFTRLNKKDYITYKKGKYQYEVLTSNKNNIRNRYNITTIDKPSIEDIMLFYIKREK